MSDTGDDLRRYQPGELGRFTQPYVGVPVEPDGVAEGTILGATGDTTYNEASATTLARNIATYHATLLDGGLRRKEAFALTSIYLQGLMDAASRSASVSAASLGLLDDDNDEEGS